MVYSVTVPEPCCYGAEVSENVEMFFLLEIFHFLVECLYSPAKVEILVAPP